MILGAVDAPIPWMERRTDWLLAALLLLAGLALVIWAWTAVRRGPGSRRCPRCGFDMRSTEGRRCNECGAEARSERPLRRLRPAARRAWIALGLLIAVAYPAYRAVLWSRDRDWTPPLSRWKTTSSIPLPLGARIELQAPRHHREEAGSRCVVIPRRGDPITYESARFVLNTDPDAGAPPEHSFDLNGDGVSEFWIMEYSGGAHCCETYHVLSIDSDGRIRELDSIDAAHGGAFEDADGVAPVEFVMRDWSLAYELGCFACIDLPKVVLRWDGARFAIDTESMRTPPPSPEQVREMMSAADPEGLRPKGSDGSSPANMANMATAEQRLEWQRQRIVSSALRLIYAGHAEIAWRLLEEGWTNAGSVDRERQRRAIETALARSPYAAQVRAMQRADDDRAARRFEFDGTKRSAADGAAP